MSGYVNQPEETGIAEQAASSSDDGSAFDVVDEESADRSVPLQTTDGPEESLLLSDLKAHSAVIREMYDLLPHSDDPLPPIETNLTSQQCKHLIEWIKLGTNLATLSHSDLFAIRRFADKFDLQALDSAIVNVFTAKCVGSSTWGIFVDALREHDEVVARAAMAIMGGRWFSVAKYRELDWSKINHKTEVKRIPHAYACRLLYLSLTTKPIVYDSHRRIKNRTKVAAWDEIANRLFMT